jgi:hypothetical protein
MAYATLANVQALIKWVTFSASSKVTSTEVTDMHIVEADAYIDSKLCKKYQVPITNATDLKVLQFISTRLAAVKIAEILVLQTSGEMPAIVERWFMDANARLEEILNFTVDLPSSTKLDSTRGLYSYTDTEEIDPIWKIGEDQW